MGKRPIATAKNFFPRVASPLIIMYNNQKKQKNMKKIFSFAVAATIVVLCAVLFSSCDAAEEKYSVEGRIAPKPRVVEKIGCVPGEAGQTTFSDGGVVEKMSTRAVNFDTPVVDGRFTATTPFTSYFINTPDSVLKYTGKDVLEVIEVNKPRYVRNMSCMSSATLKRIVNNGDTFWGTTFNDGEDHALDFGLREKWICQTLEVSDPAGGTKEFESCDNRVTDLRILGVDSIDAKRDSADYHLMYAYVTFQSTYANGAIGKFRVKLPTWKYIGGGTTKWPDGRQPVKYFYKKRWLENKTLYRIDSFMDLWVLYSDGTEADVDDQSIDLTDEVIEPEILVKEVSELTWKPEKAVSYSETADNTRARFEKKANIFVTPLVEMYAVKTDRGTQTYTLKREGRPVYVSPLGDELEFLEPTWSEKDLGWDGSDLETLNRVERKLLTNSAVFTLNGQDIPATAKIELRKVKDAEKEIIGYEYPENEKGIRPLTPNTFWSFGIQYIVFSDGSKEKVGEIGTVLNLKTIAPEKQVITVTDWEINDLSPQAYNATRTGLRRDTISTGVFTIQNLSKNFVTRTNKSSDKFVTTYDGTVTFKDKYGNEVEFIGLAVKQEDKGGVATMKSLSEADDMERKSMTTTIAVTETNTSTSANHTAEVEFRKAIEKEELLNDPNRDVELDLQYIGNGFYTTIAKIKYVWKLAGTEYETISQQIEASIAGEMKSQIILDKAEAPYVSLNQGSWSAETSSAPQQYVTVYTKTNTSISENYTTLTDKYTAKMQRAVIDKTVGGKKIHIEMLAPTSMVVAHKDGSLVDGKRTTTKNGTEYDVWDHTGSVTATVVSPKGNQTETATDIKEVLVKQEETPIIPANPEWGYPVGLASNGATLVYRKLVGDSQEGAFHKNLIIKYEKGILVVTTHSYGMKGNNWNPVDFTFTTEDFYYYGKQYYGRTLTQSNSINSAILRNDKWEPAAISMDGSGWVYVGISGNTVNMSQNLAVTAGIKNFNGETTAENNPYLRWSGKVDNNKVLTIYNSKGVPVIRFR